MNFNLLPVYLDQTLEIFSLNNGYNDTLKVILNLKLKNNHSYTSPHKYLVIYTEKKHMILCYA
jgi:hypothetical protein